MRQEPCQANGYVRPADASLVEAVNAVMRSWCLSECAVLEETALLRIAFEGVTFPLDEILDAIRPCLVEVGPEVQAASSGIIDVYDLES